MCDLNLTYKENEQCSCKLNVIHTLVHCYSTVTNIIMKMSGTAVSSSDFRLVLSMNL